MKPSQVVEEGAQEAEASYPYCQVSKRTDYLRTVATMETRMGPAQMVSFPAVGRRAGRKAISDSSAGRMGMVVQMPAALVLGTPPVEGMLVVAAARRQAVVEAGIVTRTLAVAAARRPVVT